MLTITTCLTQTDSKRILIFSRYSGQIFPDNQVRSCLNHLKEKLDASSHYLFEMAEMSSESVISTLKGYLQKHAIDAMIVADYSRLSRCQQELAGVQQFLSDQGIQLICADQ